MDLNVETYDRIFYPRSIAVVGASRDESKTGSMWVKGLLGAGFVGSVYPVNPGGGEIYGLKIHRTLLEIEGPVDLVICCIPRTLVLDLLDDCAAKKIGAIHFFTAGFRETGEPQWIEVEEDMARKARTGGFRIIGPNCMGVSCSESGIPYGLSSLLPRVGSAGFISQSGGHAGKMVAISYGRHLGFSKLVSIGNCCDLGSADFLEYLGNDPKTSVVGLYLEGPRDSRRLFHVLPDVARKKPVVVWKGGRTAAGAKAASSHTGALAASAAVWSAALRQAGAVEVHGLDELADTLLLFQKAGDLGKRASVGIICGLTDGGGGEAVLAADACAAADIDVTPFTEKTRRDLLAILGQVGSVLVNPVDVSQRAGNLDAFERALELVASEPSVDIVAVYENVDILVTFLPQQITDAMHDAVIGLKSKQPKPVILVSPPGALDMQRLEIENKMAEAGIPVFPSMERAAKAIGNVRRHSMKRAV